MKAPSDILTTAQKPFTIFGMPPKLFALVAGLGVLTLMLLSTFKLKVLAFFAAGAVMIFGFYYIWKLNQEDCHVEQKVTVGFKFFKGKNERHLVAGFPQEKKTKKERAF